MTMSRADPWGEFTFQKGFLWAQIVARHGGELRRCPDQFPSVISTVGDGRAAGGGEGWPWHTWLLGEGGSRDIKWCGVWSLLCTPGDPLALLWQHTVTLLPSALLLVVDAQCSTTSSRCYCVLSKEPADSW